MKVRRKENKVIITTKNSKDYALLIQLANNEDIPLMLKYGNEGEMVKLQNKLKKVL